MGLAVTGGALISGAASYFGGREQSRAAKEAGALQAAAMDRATAEQRRQYDVSRADLAPYREAGTTAMGEYGRLFGVGREGLLDEGEMIDARRRFQATPGYQFRMSEGQKAVQRAGAAGGRYHSGAGAKALTRFSQGLASQEFGTYANRLANIAGMGQGATNVGVRAGQQTAANIGNIAMRGAGQQGGALQAAATARASGYVGAANAATGALRDYGMYRYTQGVPGAPGGAPIYGDYTGMPGAVPQFWGWR